MKTVFKVYDNVDRTAALLAYERLAKSYDASCHRIEPIRKTAIELLALKEGETVFDVASGTGKSLPMLAKHVGATGRVIAIEQSPDMADISKGRVGALGLGNVLHLIAPVEEAFLIDRADAVLFHYTHDVFRNPIALNNIFSSARPGARIVVAGYKEATGFYALFNPWFRYRARGYLSTYEGLAKPWSHLIKHVPNLTLKREFFLGSGYLANGSVPLEPSSSQKN